MAIQGLYIWVNTLKNSQLTAQNESFHTAGFCTAAISDLWPHIWLWKGMMKTSLFLSNDVHRI